MIAASLARHLRAVLLALLALALFAAGLPAEKPLPQPKQVAPVESRVFAVFALEETCRNLRFALENIGEPGSSIRHARLARQKLLLGELRLGLNNRRGVKDEEFLVLLKGCDKLYALNEKLCKAVDEAEKETFAPVFAMVKRNQKERQIVEAAKVALFFNIAFGPRRTAPDGVRSLLGVSNDEAERNLARLKKLGELYADRCEAFVPQVGEAIEEYQEKFDALLADERKTAEEQIAALAKRYKWKETPEFDPTWDRVKGELRPGDPYRILQRILVRIADVDFEKDERKPGAARRQAARELMKASALFPPGNTTYDFHRAGILYLAGTVANESAMLQLGTVGFRGSRKSAPDTAVDAVSAWRGFIKIESLNSGDPDVIHNFLLAHANSGSPGTQKWGYDALNQPNRMGSMTSSGRPLLFYDFARLAANCGKEAEASNCLRLAARFGFDKFEEAKVNPDLRLALTSDQIETALKGGAAMRPRPPIRVLTTPGR